MLLTTNCKAMPITSIVTLLSIDGFSFLSNSGFMCGKVLSTPRNMTIPVIKEINTR